MNSSLNNTSDSNKNKIKFGLKLKLSIFVILLIITVVSIISFILTYSVTRREERQLAQELQRNMTLSIDYLSFTACDSIVSQDDLLLINIVEKVSYFKDVEYVIVTDIKNIVLGHSKGVEKTGDKLTDQLSKNALNSDNVLIQPEFSSYNLSEEYNISSPMFFKGKKIGVVRIGYSTKNIFNNIALVRKNILTTSFYVVIATIIIGIIGAILLANITTNPIKILVNGLRLFGKGEFDYRINIKNKDELGYLADEFNKMAKDLKQYQGLLVEKEVEKNLYSIAKRIQNSLVPQENMKSPEVNVAKYFNTVFGVGGDYYDYFQIDNDHLGVMISDVFGKGIPAALVMVTIRTLLHTYKGGILNSSAELVDIINKRIVIDFKGEQYATLFFIILNKKTGELIFTNAGHLPLLIYRRSEDKFLTEEKGELPIGMLENTEYKNYRFQLKKDDLIILNTDGITEAENIAQEQFNYIRLKETIKQYKEFNADKIIENVISKIDEFTKDAPQHDDMTFILIEYKGG